MAVPSGRGSETSSAPGMDPIPGSTREEEPTMRPLTKMKAGVVAVATVAITTTLAYAFWTGQGSGTGSADTGEGSLALTVRQTSVVNGMGPGDSAQTLSGDFDNPNTGPVYVGTVTVSIASVTKDPSAVAGTCDASDYTLTGAAMTVNAEVPAGNGRGAWGGATIRFNNKNVNQDACKGATVNLAYTLS